MRKFENQVQLIKYEVLKEVSRLALEGRLDEDLNAIPSIIDPGPEPRTRCCIYKERAITVERVKLALGGDKSNPNVVEVLETACDACPINRFVVTEACRGCLAHRCYDACPVDAIHFVEHRAYINPNKCIECGKCKEVCPYNAISDVMRPCRRACPTSALSINEEKKAVIDNEKCIQCGACVYQCPFGAVMDKSSIVEIIQLLKKAKYNKDTKVYAVIAPAISSQFTYAKIGQVVNGIKMLGFHNVVEAALGADIIAKHEAMEFVQKIENQKIMTSSCCPAFVSFIKKNYPMLESKISHSVSPMIAVSRLIKNTDENAIVVFIGPCIAKKKEIKENGLRGSVDFVMTFEELAALLDAAEIKVEYCDEDVLDNASFFGRIFARTGGLTEAVRHVMEADNIDIAFKPVSCDGIKECDKALKLARVNKLDGNFIEGMGCIGGCIGGAASLHHGPKDRNEVDKYGKLAMEKDINDSLRIFDIDKLVLDRNLK